VPRPLPPSQFSGGGAVKISFEDFGEELLVRSKGCHDFWDLIEKWGGSDSDVLGGWAHRCP
jgi:hypothetical protein